MNDTVSGRGEAGAGAAVGDDRLPPRGTLPLLVHCTHTILHTVQEVLAYSLIYYLKAHLGLLIQGLLHHKVTSAWIVLPINMALFTNLLQKSKGN